MSNSRVVARERDRTSEWPVRSLAVAGFLLFLMSQLFPSQAQAALGSDDDMPEPAFETAELVTGSIPSALATVIDVQMKFIQIGGARAGHVKVVLTPDDRPLSVEEARSAARQAFLETLNEVSFADNLKIVTIVVHRFPGQEDPDLDLQMSFRDQGEGRWTIEHGE